MIRRVVTDERVGELGRRWTRRGALRCAAEHNRNGPWLGLMRLKPVEYKVERVRLFCWAVVGYQAKLIEED